MRVAYRLLVVLALGASLAAAPDARGELYKWVDEKGTIHFGERPPPGGGAERIETRSPAPSEPARPHPSEPTDSDAGVYSGRIGRREGAFTLHVPPGWLRLSDEETRALDEGGQARYRAAFRPADPDAPVRLFVAVKDGRLADAEYFELLSDDLDVDAASSALSQQLRDQRTLEAGESMTLEDMRLDPDTNTIWATNDFDGVLLLTGIVLTEEARVFVGGVVPREEAEAYLPVIQRVIESVEVAEELVYYPVPLLTVRRASGEIEHYPPNARPRPDARQAAEEAASAAAERQRVKGLGRAVGAFAGVLFVAGWALAGRLRSGRATRALARAGAFVASWVVMILLVDSLGVYAAAAAGSCWFVAVLALAIFGKLFGRRARSTPPPARAAA
jgi:hypothetical protein